MNLDELESLTDEQKEKVINDLKKHFNAQIEHSIRTLGKK